MLGVLSGLFLAGLIGYSIRLVWQPLSAQERARSLGAGLVAILAAIAIAKIAALFFFPGFKWDVANAQRWSMALAQGGPTHVYDAAVDCDYPPGGYLYLLWLAGIIARGLSARGDCLRVITETPPIVADLLAALVVFVAARRLGHARYAFGAMLAFALNPALIYDSVVWGQKDSVLTLPLLLSVMLAVDRRYALAWALAAVAMLAKPQGMILMPVLALWTLFTSGPRQWIGAISVFVAALLIVAIPFALGHPWYWLIALYAHEIGEYAIGSVNAFNLMAILGGMGKADSAVILGVSRFSLGMTLLASNYVLVAWLLWRNRTPEQLLYAVFLAYLGFFMLGSRIHERYLYYAVAILTPLAFAAPVSSTLCAGLSLTLLCNLAYAKAFAESAQLTGPLGAFGTAVATVNLALFGVATFYAIAGARSSSAREPLGLIANFLNIKVAEPGTSSS